MKCIYCEENETKGVLLCYGCQVDLFPLVSAWVYCGICGKELPSNTTTCPYCAPTEPLSAPVAVPAEPVSSAAPPEKKKTPLPSLIPEPPATPEEVKAARRFQWIIRGAFALFWLCVLILILMWFRSYVNQPIDGIP
ncbi:MAG TPA: hypothetical protein VFZ34_01995 [Blastocatellia bacterium]|nr:hypothetical protein [Blastocatellia bacterium]